jgi:hypothetical protein
VFIFRPHNGAVFTMYVSVFTGISPRQAANISSVSQMLQTPRSRIHPEYPTK